jgi:hypothetical protein
MVEVRISELQEIEIERFVNVHGLNNLISMRNSNYYSIYNKKKIPVGWYSKDNLRVAFYYNPSFISKQKMYWLYGWSWESNGKT